MQITNTGTISAKAVDQELPQRVRVERAEAGCQVGTDKGRDQDRVGKDREVHSGVQEIILKNPVEERDDRRVNAKSLLGVLSLGIVGGAEIKIIADGADEEDAVNGLVDLVESGFAD